LEKILTEALVLAKATSRSLLMNARAADWHLYPHSAWMNFRFISGSEFETPIPIVTCEGVIPFPPAGYRALHPRMAFFRRVTGIKQASAMRLPGIGSQYQYTCGGSSGAPQLNSDGERPIFIWRYGCSGSQAHRNQGAGRLLCVTLQPRGAFASVPATGHKGTTVSVQRNLLRSDIPKPMDLPGDGGLPMGHFLGLMHVVSQERNIGSN
jgi:hypothetical protein